MKPDAGSFALLGGEREFAGELHVGQLYFPEWERYEAAMRGIVDRRYYTNHGPLVRELEARLEAFFGVRHAITVTNATLGLYLVCLASELQGKVLMPAFTFTATADAVVLAGLDPVFCDVDRATHHLTVETADAALEDGVSGVCAVHLWGGAADVPLLQDWARARGLVLFFDSAHGFGAERPDGLLGRFGRAEVFSFHATKVMSATEGGCITTDDDELAERIRNMRSNYGIRRPVKVPLTVNARMSEAQAAIALMSLDDLDERIAHNLRTHEAYRDALAEVAGVRLVEPSHVTRSNWQSCVLEIDEERYGLTRDQLRAVLRAEGVRARRYFKPGVHRSPPFDTRYPQYAGTLPVTDDICERVLQLPVGALVPVEAASRVGDLVRDAGLHAARLRDHA